jgi:hypothetical protein
VKAIAALGKQMSNVLHNRYDADDTKKTLQAINDKLTGLTLEITGCRADQLADENLEDKPIVRLYWTTLSELTAKMFMAAAEEQSYYAEADK